LLKTKIDNFVDENYNENGKIVKKITKLERENGKRLFENGRQTLSEYDSVETLQQTVCSMHFKE